MFKETSKASAIIMFGPILMGLVMAILIPNVSVNPKFFVHLTWTLYGIGFLLFLFAKISTIKNGNLITFGSSQMTKKNRFLYKSGYSVMIIAFVLTICLVLAYKFTLIKSNP